MSPRLLGHHTESSSVQHQYSVTTDQCHPFKLIPAFIVQLLHGLYKTHTHTYINFTSITKDSKCSGLGDTEPHNLSTLSLISYHSNEVQNILQRADYSIMAGRPTADSKLLSSTLITGFIVWFKHHMFWFACPPAVEMCDHCFNYFY